MSDHELPADLAELHRRLQRRPSPQPPAALRERVLATVRAGVNRGGFWKFAAAVAAAAVLAINLSMSAANNTDWHLAAPVSDGRNVRVREMPEASSQEVQRQALLRRGRAQLTGEVPVSRPSRSLRLFSEE